MVKELTGGDLITARRMNEDFWTFDPTHKLVLATNHRPQIIGTDHGIWRRVHLVPFRVTISKDEDDKQLPRKLLEELPGILNWAVAGALEWQAAGLAPPPEVLDATAEYRLSMDVLHQFIEEACVLDPQAEVAKGQLYDSYLEWCSEASQEPLSKNDLGSAMK